MLYSDCQVVLGVLPIGTVESAPDAQVPILSPDENPAVLSGTSFDASRQSGVVMIAPGDDTFSLVHHTDHVVMMAPGDAPYPPDPRAHLTFTMAPKDGTFALEHHPDHVVMIAPGDGPRPPDPK